MDLASRDSYIQKFASKAFSQQDQAPKKRPFAHFTGKTDIGAPKKKKKCKKKHAKERHTDEKTNLSKPKTLDKSSVTGKPSGPKDDSRNGSITQTSKGFKVQSNFSTVDVLRQRLHEKIEESRGQGAPHAPSEAVLAKRAKRKLERERKKRKRKEFQMKKLADENGEEVEQVETKQEKPPGPAASKRNETSIVFNKIETVESVYLSKEQKKKNKKQVTKGELTPLTGKNYKQLLSRVQARKEKVEKLREKDEGKARQMEEKMKWTNLLYKAEGIKIKDDENMLRTRLKNKEKRRDQRKKTWATRSENIIGKMQQRQDKRQRNIQKRKQMKTEKKKDRARKKGRILPEDLKKVAL